MPTENEPEQNNLIKPKSPLPDAVPAGYAEFLRDIKARVQTAQIRAALAVNKELVLLYWGIGRDILQRQQEQGWGTKVIDKLAADLRRDIPDMTGWSLRNLKYMRSFAEAWPNESIVQAPLAQLTWYHNIALVEKAFGSDQRLWYARAAIEHGFRSSFRGTCVI
jgi:predicted nuclease of restriction endonuclease-like (RecB) superfamily